MKFLNSNRNNLLSTKPFRIIWVRSSPFYSIKLLQHSRINVKSQLSKFIRLFPSSLLTGTTSSLKHGIQTFKPSFGVKFYLFQSESFHQSFWKTVSKRNESFGRSIVDVSYFSSWSWPLIPTWCMNTLP